MARNFKLERTDLKQWIVMDDDAQPLDIPAENATIEHVQAALDALNDTEGELKVTMVELNSTGDYLPVPDADECMDMTDPKYVKNFTTHGLPEFYEVRVTRTVNGAVETYYILLPTTWNGRLLAVCGMGLRAMQPGFAHTAPFAEIINYWHGLMGHFSTVYSDGANLTPGLFSWAYDAETGEMRTEAIKNVGFRSAHWRALIGKAVTEAIYGQKPEYSYLEGASGGGREAVVDAVEYPEDYDGIMAFAPAVYYGRMSFADCWPHAVMNTYHDFLPRPKFEAFQKAVWEKYGGRDGWLKELHPTFDATACIGTETEWGPITELDAKVMQMIWDGPRRDGVQLAWGAKPGLTIFGPGGMLGDMGFIGPAETVLNENGEWETRGWCLFIEWMQAWAMNDLNWDWRRNLTIDTFMEVYEKTMASEEVGYIACENEDLSAFVKAGGKMIMTIGQDDDSVPPESLIGFYDKAAEICGGKDELKRGVRLFLTPGNGHGHLIGGPGVCTAEGFIALMKWVEDGIAPESIHCDQFDINAFSICKTAEVDVY